MGDPCFNRLCYIAKINEKQLSQDSIEREINNWTNTVCMNQENMGEGGMSEYNGFAVVLGPWIVHLFEADTPLMTTFVKKLQEKNNEDGSYYQNIWVLHYTEDVPTRAYPTWTCKNVPSKDATREIKSLPPFEKTLTIYDGMVQIGNEAMSMKDESKLQSTLKNGACQYIPCGEELASVIDSDTFTLDEWIEYAYDTPDICLEKEMQWPDEPDLIY